MSIYFYAIEHLRCSIFSSNPHLPLVSLIVTLDPERQPLKDVS